MLKKLDVYESILEGIANEGSEGGVKAENYDGGCPICRENSASFFRE